MNVFSRLIILPVLLALLFVCSNLCEAQVRRPHLLTLQEVVRAELGAVTSEVHRVESESSVPEPRQGMRKRQRILLSGLAVSMVAYGLFALRFNNSRADSEAVHTTYEQDVSDNAQRYIDEGVNLDQIPTYKAWEEAYTDAANARELVALAGTTAFLVGLFAILDAATAGNDAANTRSERMVRPSVSVASFGDILIGARVKL